MCQGYFVSFLRLCIIIHRSVWSDFIHKLCFHVTKNLIVYLNVLKIIMHVKRCIDTTLSNLFFVSLADPLHKIACDNHNIFEVRIYLQYFYFGYSKMWYLELEVWEWVYCFLLLLIVFWESFHTISFIGVE